MSKQEAFPPFPSFFEICKEERGDWTSARKIWKRKVDEWRVKTKKTLRELLENSPKYPDDVGGMYPVEVQMYACDVDEFVEKVKQFLEALK